MESSNKDNLDKYDIEINRLLEFDDNCFSHAINMAWSCPNEIGNGCLFQYVTKNGHSSSRNYDNTRSCGCLTQIKTGQLVAYTEELTLAIQADNRIPRNSNTITKESLPVFAEWQRKADKEIRNL